LVHQEAGVALRMAEAAVREAVAAEDGVSVLAVEEGPLEAVVGAEEEAEVVEEEADGEA